MTTQRISVRLNAEIVSVSGYVNGIEVEWNLIGGAWQAVCARVADGDYHVQITAVNEFGTSSYFDFTLHHDGLYLITWREQADVSRVKYLTKKIIDGVATAAEREEWLSGEMIGAYNASDLNRVGKAMAYIADRLSEIGVVVSVSGKQDWQMTDIPTKDSLAYYLSDVGKIRNALAVSDETPTLPDDMIGLTWQEANDIEQILLDIDGIITLIMRSWMYAGEVYAGGMQ